MRPAAWAWIILAALIVVLVVGFDVWAHFTGNQSMSGQFHDWLHGTVTGPLIVGVSTGVLAGLALHLITTSSN